MYNWYYFLFEILLQSRVRMRVQFFCFSFSVFIIILFFLFVFLCICLCLIFCGCYFVFYEWIIVIITDNQGVRGGGGVKLKIEIEVEIYLKGFIVQVFNSGLRLEFFYCRVGQLWIQYKIKYLKSRLVYKRKLFVCISYKETYEKKMDVLVQIQVLLEFKIQVVEGNRDSLGR